jgi:hypothetical protein
MNATYDIFRDFPDDGPIWIEAVQGLENARARLMKLHETRSGDYFVYDPTSSKIVATAIESAPIQVPSTLCDASPPTGSVRLQTTH